MTRLVATPLERAELEAANVAKQLGLRRSLDGFLSG